MPEPDLPADALTVQCPPWRAIPGLTHGVTTRAALPEPGKADFFATIAQARAAGAIPTALTIGAEQVHEDHLEAIEELAGAWQFPPGFRSEAALRACEFPRTDALMTTLPGVMLVIQTADCLPVFAVDPVRRAVGLAHCGWRGLLTGLAGKLAREMDARGAQAARLQVWLGPCIRVGRYEVGPALVEQFRAAFPGAPVCADETHLDLPAVARWQLAQAGIDPKRIFDCGECTLGQSDRYHSYRGAGDQAGRMLSFIGFDL